MSFGHSHNIRLTLTAKEIVESEFKVRRQIWRSVESRELLGEDCFDNADDDVVKAGLNQIDSWVLIDKLVKWRIELEEEDKEKEKDNLKIEAEKDGNLLKPIDKRDEDDGDDTDQSSRGMDLLASVMDGVVAWVAVVGGYKYGQRWLEMKPRHRWCCVLCTAIEAWVRIEDGSVRRLEHNCRIMARTPLRMGMNNETQELLCSSNRQNKALGDKGQDKDNKGLQEERSRTVDEDKEKNKRGSIGVKKSPIKAR
ncbi:hypothetical protein BY996DRAFT_6616616, partial [Phakopsora pachyrhizi]